MPSVKASLLLAVLMVAVQMRPAHAVDTATWKAAENLQSPSYVVEKRGEKVLAYRNSEMAGALLGTFFDPPQIVVESISAKLQKAIAGGVATNIPNSSLSDIYNLTIDESASVHVRRLIAGTQITRYGSMEKDGFSVRSFPELRIISKEFNRLDSRKAYSIYVIHVIEASNLLGRPGTVAIGYRVDHETKWGWSSGHDPFSFGKHKIKTRVIDEALFAAISNSQGKVQSAFVGVFGGEDFYEYIDQWRLARNSLPLSLNRSKGPESKRPQSN